MLLIPKGDLEEARVVWRMHLERDPSDDDAWYGYAPLCLYLGNQNAYRLARTALLDHYKNANPNWIVAERAARLPAFARVGCRIAPHSVIG